MNKKTVHILSVVISLVLVFAMQLNCFAGTVKGDVNGDGEITYADATLAMLYVRNNEFTNVSKYDFSNIDMDDDEMITSTDAAIIKSLGTEDPVPDAATLYVFGDSTGCDYAPTADPSYYYKRVGFGTRLPDYFVDSLTIKNYALSGRSSKDFLTDPTGKGYYDDYVENVKAGDYVIIAFGHNDDKADDATRYTDPVGDENTAGSFKHSIYQNYVLPAVNAKANVILCTPIVRRTATGEWSDGNLHVANGGDYSEAMRELASKYNYTLIDNTALTKALYDKLTPAGTVYLHAWSNSKEASVDNTHLNNYGAAWVAYLMSDSIADSQSSLKNYLKVGNVEPNKGKLIVNPDYKERVQGEIEKSAVWKTTDPWWGTVFGDVGGQGKIYTVDTETGKITLGMGDKSGKPNFNIEEVASGASFSFNIRAGAVSEDNPNSALETVGKVASNTDGIAAVFQTVDSGVNFAISANAHVNGLSNGDGQVAFGAIVLNEIDIDYSDPGMYHYVAASPLKMNGGVDGMFSGYSRTVENNDATKATTRVEGNDAAPSIPQAGDVIPVKITKVGNTYTVEYNGIVGTVTTEFSDDVYVGFFAARCADITFTDIVFNNEVVEP